MYIFVPVGNAGGFVRSSFVFWGLVNVSKMSLSVLKVFPVYFIFFFKAAMLLKSSVTLRYSEVRQYLETTFQTLFTFINLDVCIKMFNGSLFHAVALVNFVSVSKHLFFLTCL